MRICAISPTIYGVDATLLHIDLVGANPRATIVREEPLPGVSNYLIGNDPRKWRTQIPAYARVRYRQVYPGIDLVYYGTEHSQLEYDFVVVPGADPNAIALHFSGGREPKLTRNGDLTIQLRDGSKLVQRAPVIYQLKGATRQPVAGKTVLSRGRIATFSVS